MQKGLHDYTLCRMFATQLNANKMTTLNAKQVEAIFLKNGMTTKVTEKVKGSVFQVEASLTISFAAILRNMGFVPHKLQFNSNKTAFTINQK